jgi:hypothetical protein
MERCLHARRAIRIALLVRFELKPVALSERRHLGRRDHGGARAGGHRDVSVVDHAHRGGTVEVAQRLSEEPLALEAREARITLEEDQPRVAQHQRSALYRGDHPADLGPMRARVVLHFAACGEVVSARRPARLAGERMPPAERRQRRVGELRAVFDELFVHAAEVALEADDELKDLLAVGLRLLGTLEQGCLGAAARDHAPDARARKLQLPRDRARTVPGFGELQDRRARGLIQHGRARTRSGR